MIYEWLVFRCEINTCNMKHEILIIDEEKADIDIGLNNIVIQV